MEGNPGRGAPGGETYPKLLDLIPNGSGWMERDACGGGGHKEFGVAEEQKLELRLGLPGGEDWRVGKEQKEDPSLGFLPRASKCGINTTAGAKRGFVDTLDGKIQGFQQQQPQKPSFLRFAPTSGMGKESPHKANGINTEELEQQQGLDKEAGLPASPASKNAVASRDGSHSRSIAAPVGWPPIRSFRKNLASSSSKPPQPQNANSRKAEKPDICSKGMFVKINMDGIPIGRKVDLKAYDSYEKLSSVVDELFSGLLAAQKEPSPLGSPNEQGPGQAITGLLDGSGEFTLVYEDKEGDVLLVGDVPWSMFVSAVKRLRVLKSSDLSVLCLAAVNRKRCAAEVEV